MTLGGGERATEINREKRRGDGVREGRKRGTQHQGALDFSLANISGLARNMFTAQRRPRESTATPAV